MKLYYVTLNTVQEAQQISEALLLQQLAICTNWFPITAAFRWEGGMTIEPEIVLLIKTQSGYREALESVIKQYIPYNHLIAEIATESVNESFLDWLNAEIPKL